MKALRFLLLVLAPLNSCFSEVGPLTAVACDLQAEGDAISLSFRNEGGAIVLIDRGVFSSTGTFPPGVSVYFLAENGKAHGTAEGYGWRPRRSDRLVAAFSDLRPLKAGETIERRLSVAKLISSFRSEWESKEGITIEGTYKVIVFVKAFPYKSYKELRKAFAEEPYRKPTASAEKQAQKSGSQENFVFVVNMPGFLRLNDVEQPEYRPDEDKRIDPELAAREQAAVFKTITLEAEPTCAGPN